MDLGAYAQIEDLGKIAANNGIEVPRLRGYRLMNDEKPVSLEELYAGVEVDECEFLIEQGWINSHCYTLSWTTDMNKRKYMKYHKETTEFTEGRTYTHYVFESVKWEKIHGKHRKALKLAIKQRKKAIKTQYDMWNKYCGRDDVLYIHSRIGGNNWRYFNGDELVASQPWFLDRVNDNFDSTYCDIYAKIDPNTIKED